jgi:hypothetical protein
MANFNTYQTRHLYVAKAIDSTHAVNTDDFAVGSINLKSTATGELYFVYKNADGLASRSDTINPCWIRSLKKTASADMDRPLIMHTVAVDTNVVTLSNLVGKTLDCTIQFNEFIDYSANSTLSITASVTANATNTASAAAFHKDLAIAIAKAIPDSKYPYLKVFSNGSQVTSKTDPSNVTGASGGVVLVEAVQKYVRGKLTGEPIPFTVSFSLSDANIDDIAWGTDTQAESNISGNLVYPATYVAADLEYFALGERGDVYRGSTWPNNYEPTYAIDLSKKYDFVTVEFYWQGTAENVQKSPRMIQIACEVSGSGSQATSIAGDLYDAIEAAMNGNGSGSSTGA